VPCTFSHPLAVIPLRCILPGPLRFAALVIGSLSPDFGYYISAFRLASFAHTLPGTFALCLPTGLLALAAFYLLRRSLCFVLPQPHRTALLPLTLANPRVSVASFLIMCVCILLGAWTHTIWDSFTHPHGWAVQRIALLRTPLELGATSLPLSYILQQASTFGAGTFLVVLYCRWLRNQPSAIERETAPFSDRSRYALLASLAFVAVVLAVPRALRISSLFEGYFAFRVFLFRLAIYSAGAFVPLVMISSLAFYVAHRRYSAQTRPAQ
jgi:hypothetical protein